MATNSLASRIELLLSKGEVSHEVTGVGLALGCSIREATTPLLSSAGFLPNPRSQLKMGIIYWSQIQRLTLTTTFKKAEVIHATPQALSTLLRWA